MEGGRAGDRRHGDRTTWRARSAITAGRATCRRTRRLAASASDDFFEAYRFIVPGYNVRPLEICGAVGVEQLKKLDRMLEIRRANAALFVELFRRATTRFILQREHGCSSWFSFTIILNPGTPHRSRDA